MYLTSATDDADGVPWVSPVWFVIYNSTKAEGESSALYSSATAALVEEADLEDALAVYNALSVTRGLCVWGASRL